MRRGGCDERPRPPPHTGAQTERDVSLSIARRELRLIEQWYGMTAGERAWRYTQVTSAERTVLQQSGGMAWARGDR